MSNQFIFEYTKKNKSPNKHNNKRKRRRSSGFNSE